MADLSLYNQKRDFTRTQEPPGKVGRKRAKALTFVVQKHAARRLHYDFRLELDGVLKSWAVTRGPSLNPADKRLAVEVEDHPLKYGGFEGLIPKGEYGGGTVMLWDQGTWEPTEDPHQGLKDGSLKFRLHGHRLKGEWALVRMKPRPQDKGRSNWLLIKHQDEAARDDEAEAWLNTEATSILSTRSMEEITADSDNVWSSKKGGKVPPQTRKKASAPLPDFVPPQLATLSTDVPLGEDWVHEVKFDGYRCIARIDKGKVRLLTRTGLDWTKKYAPLPELLGRLPVTQALLDGEIIVVDEATGRADFKALQATLAGERDAPLQFYAFDLMHVDGEDLRPLPLSERKARLEALLQQGAELDDRIHYSAHFTEDAARFKDKLCQLDFEGLISKRSDAPYRSGRGTGWVKVKCHKRQEFVIGGFTEPSRGGRGIGALLLGYFHDERFIYAGKVGTGFTQDSAMAVRRRLDVLARKTAPFSDPLPALARRGAQFVRPELVAEVRFAEWTADGHLRHPSFQGLREDKPARSIGREVASPVAKATKDHPMPTKSTTPSRKRKSEDPEVAGIRISSADRLIFPGTDITKGDLATFYADIADHILPHVAGRPLSMIRCPEGAGEHCFFQRHLNAANLPHIKNTGIKVNGRDEDYVMIEDERGLVTLIQWGVIELHPWGCMARTPDKPDRLIFDLDPDEGAPFEYVVSGAQEVRARMKELGLDSFLKVTGGKGVHVVIPLKAHFGWDAIKAFTRAIAESMAHDSPDRFIAKASKAARKGKVFVDYLRNDHTATAVAAYSVRARKGAPVAMPTDWAALTQTLNPAQYTVMTVREHPATRATDPWADFFTTRQTLSPHVLKALDIAPK